MGTWKVIGSTNRWPRVVNMWEMDGWEQWAETLERQFVPAKRDAALAPWWAKATEWRSGGFDRILEPTRVQSDLRARCGSTASRHGCACTRSRNCGPASARRISTAVGETLAPVLAARGLTLMGAYAVPDADRRGDAAVGGAGLPSALSPVRGSARTTPTCGSGDARVGTWRQAAETMWLVPSADCFFHPEFRGDDAARHR